MILVCIYKKSKEVLNYYRKQNKDWVDNKYYFKYLEKNKSMAIIMDSDHEITMTNLIRIGTFSYIDRDEPYIRWEIKYSRKYKKYIYNYHNNKQNLKQYLEEYNVKEIEKLLNREHILGESNFNRIEEEEDV